MDAGADATAAVRVRVHAPLRLPVDADPRLQMDVVALLARQARRKDLKDAYAI